MKTTKQKYIVHVRTDPRNTRYARVIQGFTTSCKPDELYEEIAVLESFLQLEFPSYISRAIYINRNGKFKGTDEHTILPEQDRQKIDKLIPKMLKKDKQDLEKLAGSYFIKEGWRNYIG